MKPKGESLRGWDGKSCDCYNLIKNPFDVPNYVSDVNKFILLKKIAEDNEMKNCVIINEDVMRLFEKEPVSLRRRESFFAHYDSYKQQIVCIDFLKQTELKDFAMFLAAVGYRKEIKERFGNPNIKILCRQSSLSTHDIADTFLPKFISLAGEVKSDEVVIENIEENTDNILPQEIGEFISNISEYKIHVSRFDSDSKKYVTAYFGNASAKIKESSGAPFKPIARYLSDSKDVYIFYDNVPDINTVVSTVLKDLVSSNVSMEIDLLSGYIHSGNDTKTTNYLSGQRNFARVQKRVVLDWADFASDEVPDIGNNYTAEIIYRLLTARGSYDIYCPICADIPLKTFDYEEDTKNNHSRKIIVLENDNPDTREEYPYIITVACSYCFEKLRHTLSKSEFDGKRLTLTTQIAQGQHEKMKSRHRLELSPINIALMKKIKFGRNR